MASGSLLAILLTDVEGSSVLWERAPDATAAALDRLDELVDQAVERHGGRVLKERGEGDSHFAVFGDAPSARIAAAELQEALGAEEWVTPEPVRVRMAIAAGEAVRRLGDYSGPMVNRASRLRSLAIGGQVLVGGAAAVGDPPEGWVLVDLGVHELPRLGVKEQIFELRPATRGVESLPADRSSLEWTDAGALHPFLGRDRELADMLSGFRLSAGGSRRLVVVTGEAGIGKTRLVAEAARRAATDGALVLFGRCTEAGLVPFAPFVESLGELARREPEAELRLQLASLQTDVAQVVPAVAAKLGARPDAASAVDRMRLFEAVESWLTVLARRQPLVLVIDDLQWIDGDSLALVTHLLLGFEPMPLCVVATVRVGELPGLGRLTNLLGRLAGTQRLDRIDLSGLDVDAIAELSERSATSAVDAPWLLEQTGGNPFYILELVRHLGGGGLGEALPTTLRDVIAARAGRLGDDVARALCTAAVAGTEFSVDLVQELLGPERDALDPLERAAAAHLLRELPGDRFGFAHGVVQSVLASQLSDARQRRLHAKVAQVLSGDLVRWGATTIDVAHHQCAAVPHVDAVSAARTALDAAAEASARFAFETAAAILCRGLDVLGRGEAPEVEAALLLAVAEARYQVGDRPDGDVAIHRAADLATELGRSDLLAAAALKMGGFISAMHEPDPELLTLFDRALEAQAGNPATTACLLGRRAVWKALSEDRSELDAETAEAVRLARQSGDAVALATALHARLECSAGPQSTAETAAAAAELTELAVSLDDIVLIAQAWRLRGLVALIRGDLVTADLAAAALAAHGTRTRLRQAELLGRQWRGVRAGIRGEWAVAEEEAQRVTDRLRAMRSPQRNLVIVTIGAPWDWVTGRPLREEASLRRLVDRYPQRTSWLLQLALTEARMGRPDEARRLLERTGPIVANEVWGPTAAMLAAAALELGDDGWARHARAVLGEHPDVMCAGGMTTFWGPARLYLGMLASLLGDLDRAIADLQLAADVLGGLGGRPLAALARAWLARSLAEVGAEDAASTERAWAHATAEELGLGLVARVLAGGAGRN